MGPGESKVEVDERAQVHHIWNILPHRFVDHVIAGEAFRLRNIPAQTDTQRDADGKKSDGKKDRITKLVLKKGKQK